MLCTQTSVGRVVCSDLREDETISSNKYFGANVDSDVGNPAWTHHPIERRWREYVVNEK